MTLSRLLQISCYPLIVFGAVALHLFLMSLGLFPDLVPSVVATIVLATVFASEYLLPFRSQWLQRENVGEIWRDGASTLVMLPVVMAGCQFFWEKVFPRVDIWPHEAPFAIRVVLAVLIAEFFFYWTHRLSHEIAFLWRFHSVHHSVKRVYWLNSGMLHPVDAFLNFFVYFFPLFAIGVDHEVFLMFLTLTMTTGVMEHANVNFKAGIFNYVFNTGELHRWHHSKTIEISKKNCGKILSVWDLVFGTFYYPKQHAGIEKVGVEE